MTFLLRCTYLLIVISCATRSEVFSKRSHRRQLIPSNLNQLISDYNQRHSYQTQHQSAQPVHESTQNHFPSINMSSLTDQILNTREASLGYIDLMGIYHSPTKLPSSTSTVAPPSPLPTLTAQDRVLFFLENPNHISDPAVACKALTDYYADYADVCCTVSDGEWSFSDIWSCKKVPTNYEAVGIFHRVTFHTSARLTMRMSSLWIMSTTSGRAQLTAGRFFKDSICSRSHSVSNPWQYLYNDLQDLFSPVYDTREIPSICEETNGNRQLLEIVHLFIGESPNIKLQDLITFRKNTGLFVGKDAGLFLYQGTSVHLNPGAVLENFGSIFIGDPCEYLECKLPSLSLIDAASNTILAHRPVYAHSVVISQPGQVVEEESAFRTEPIALWSGLVGYPTKLPNASTSFLRMTHGLYTVYHGDPRTHFAFHTLEMPTTLTSGSIVFLDLRNHTSLSPNLLTFSTDRLVVTADAPVKMQSSMLLAFPIGNLRLRQYLGNKLTYGVSPEISYDRVEIILAGINIALDYSDQVVFEDAPDVKLRLRLQCHEHCLVSGQVFVTEKGDLGKSLWIPQS